MSKKEKQGIVVNVEKISSKFPHPIVLFFWMTVIVFVLSFVLSKAGVTAVHPSTGDTIVVNNLLSREGILSFFYNFIDNFQEFPILGVVVVMGVMIGVTEKVGFLSTVIRISVTKVNGTAVVAMISFLCVLSRLAGDVNQYIMPVLAAAVFYAIGRNPLAGAFCAYAASSAGFATCIIPSSLEIVLAPAAQSAAQLIDPSFTMTSLSAYYALFFNAIAITLVSTLVTIKFIEPRLGKYTGIPEGVNPADANPEVTPEQRTAVKKAGIATLIFLGIIVVLCIPSNSIFRNESTGSLLIESPLLDSINFLLGLLFLIPGIVYGKATGQIKDINDLVKIAADAVSDFSTFLVMAIIIGQFLRAFSDSNIGVMVGIKGGQALSSLNLPTWVIVLLFILLVSAINILMSSCMSKFLILAPVFIPMLMQLNISPVFTFWIYRIGDGITNLITPMDAVFVMLLSTVQKYDKKATIGTLFKNLIPFSVAYFVVLGLAAVLWMIFDLPLGIGGQVFLH